MFSINFIFIIPELNNSEFEETYKKTRTFWLVRSGVQMIKMGQKFIKTTYQEEVSLSLNPDTKRPLRNWSPWTLNLLSRIAW